MKYLLGKASSCAISQGKANWSCWWSLFVDCINLMSCVPILIFLDNVVCDPTCRAVVDKFDLAGPSLGNTLAWSLLEGRKERKGFISSRRSSHGRWGNATGIGRYGIMFSFCVCMHEFLLVGLFRETATSVKKDVLCQHNSLLLFF